MGSLEKPLSPAEQDARYLSLVPEIEQVFRAGYEDDRLVYHIWDHGLAVYEKNAKFRDDLRNRGVAGVPGQFMTHIDSKGHDFRYSKFFDLKLAGDNPYSSPEALTVTEGAEVLRSFGVDDFTIAEWQSHVWGTLLGRRCFSLGALTLCAADMANTGEDYQTVMKPATEKLRLEKEQLEETAVDPTTFAIGSLVVVGRYHFENLWIPTQLSKSPDIKRLHNQQRANLGNMAVETAENIGVVGEEAVRAFIGRLGEYGSRIWPLHRKGD